MTYYLTKQQLLKRLSKHYKNIVELEETETGLILKADNFKLEVKKQMVPRYDGKMVLCYGH